MKLVDFPHYVAVERYDAIRDSVISRLLEQAGISAVFQVGSVGTPGISDIDLMVLFDEGVRCAFNALTGLDKEARYLFNHNPFGTSRERFDGVDRFTFFHNYKLLWGDEPSHDARLTDEGLISILKAQTALEYLLKMYTHMTVERTYGIIKVRGLLLHIKALMYDLEFLGVTSGPVHDALRQIIDWRNNWFEAQPSKMELLDWHRRFYELLHGFLLEQFYRNSFYLPFGQVRLSMNMTLRKAKCFSSQHGGFTLPSVFGFLGRKYFNIQHRWNRFDFDVPMVSEGPDILVDRHNFLVDTARYNAQYLPHLLLPGSSLAVFS